MKQVFPAPDRGDVVRISLSPQEGRKQAEGRFAVILSPQSYNARVGLVLLCPITSSVKGYPFEVPVPPGLPVEGVIISDQAETVDWRARRAELVCALPLAVVEEVLAKLRTLL